MVTCGVELSGSFVVLGVGNTFSHVMVQSSAQLVGDDLQIIVVCIIGNSIVGDVFVADQANGVSLVIDVNTVCAETGVSDFA